jgi:hypothetical protein
LMGILIDALRHKMDEFTCLLAVYEYHMFMVVIGLVITRFDVR